ncbi:NAD-binding protein [Neisseria yangbaofengii]|uniref:NAD-binding protein n=1 Tax=Neisseria yangbaofengii TaxID=2709396 RepID=UPI0013EA6D9D|nr:NAD-binding protein [Neisseria yangbaofengii]
MTVIVVLSMLLTPLVMIARQKWLVPRFAPIQKTDDVIDEKRNVILAGLGCYGQIVHHLLRSAGFSADVIEQNETLIKGMQKLSVESYYGDASHPDLLEKAGIGTADLLILAINHPSQAAQIAKFTRQRNPNIRIIVRAHDRIHTVESVQVKITAQSSKRVEYWAVFRV